MKLQSFRDLPLQQSRVWDVLNDVEVLRRCIPGCESLAKDTDGSMVAAVVAKIGPVSAKFGGRVAFEDVVAPVSYKLVFSGQGGAAGFAKGHAQVQLEPIDGGTRLNYVSEVSIGGKLAQIGSRLVEASARKLADEFFSRLESEMGTSTAGVKIESSAPVNPDPSVVRTIRHSAKSKFFGVSSRIVWIGIGAVVAVGGGYLLAH